MQIRVDVRRSAKMAELQLSALGRELATKATYRALNRALDAVATAANREVRQTYNLRQSAVARAMRKRRASSHSLSAQLIVEGARVPLAEFGARAVWPWNVPGRNRRPGGGVSVHIKRSEGRKLVRGAFIPRGQGKAVVWRRAPGAGRFPVIALRSVSIPQAVMNRAVRAAMDRVATETFAKNFGQQIEFLVHHRR